LLSKHDAMKKLFVLLLVTGLFFLYTCEKDKEEAPKLNHAETLYGGCNNGFEKTTSLDGENDTVIVSVANDTLTIHVGVNYICCATFEGKSEYKGDTLLITVSDVCTEGDMCYCHCMCYYTFDFRYTGLETGDYPCKIQVWDALEKKFIVLFDGTITIQSL
jgi:hypothetical protein